MYRIFGTGDNRSCCIVYYSGQDDDTLSDKKKFGGQNCWKFGSVPKILSDKVLWRWLFLSQELAISSCVPDSLFNFKYGYFSLKLLYSIFAFKK